jgi:hypothetical protein
MSDKSPPARRASPAFPEAIRQFRQDIRGFSAIPQTLPRPSRTLPRLTLKPPYRRKLVVVLSLLILVAAGLRFAPQLAGSDTVPAELVGSWTTDDPRYSDRHLELTPDALILRTSVTEGTEYSVQRVQRRQIAQGSAYIIGAHSERGGDYTLMLEYHKAQNTIALGKPARVLWRRAH